MDELADITFDNVLNLIMQAIIESVTNILKLSEKQLDLLLEDFKNRLPNYMIDALNK